MYLDFLFQLPFQIFKLLVVRSLSSGQLRDKRFFLFQLSRKLTWKFTNEAVLNNSYSKIQITVNSSDNAILTIFSLKFCPLSYKVIDRSLVFLTLDSVFIHLIFHSSAAFLQVNLKRHEEHHNFTIKPFNKISCLFSIRTPLSIFLVIFCRGFTYLRLHRMFHVGDDIVQLQSELALLLLQLLLDSL